MDVAERAHAWVCLRLGQVFRVGGQNQSQSQSRTFPIPHSDSHPPAVPATPPAN